MSLVILARGEVIRRNSVLSSLILSLFIIMQDLMSEMHLLTLSRTSLSESISKEEYICVSSAYMW